MFRYSKGEGKGTWRLIEDSEKGIASAVENGAHFITVLSVSQDVDQVEDDVKIHYKGPLYFDIDSDDETESLEDCRRLLLRLYKDFGVNLNNLTIHCTGGKGFHILAPAKIFSTGRPQYFLPYTYKNMALEFGLGHLDYGIYSAGKGRMWRIENIKRATGRYKVALSAAQIFSMSFEEIYQLTLRPGEVTNVGAKEVEYAAELAALFKRSEFKPSKIITVEDSRLSKLEKDPGCIEKILKNQDVNKSRRFNQVILTLAGYAKGRQWSLSDFEDKLDDFIEAYPSSIYKTKRDKLRHIRGIFRYVNKSSSYQFSCQNMRRTVACELDCCPGCPINEAEMADSYDPTLGIEISHNCYYRKTDSGRTQLSTFIIHPTSVIEFIDSREACEFTIYTNIIADNKHTKQVVFSQPDWGSKSALLKKLPHPDFAYIGGDTDVQRIFKIVSQIEVPKKVGVKSVGLHKTKDKWHFVSSEGSISANGDKDELLLDTDYYLPTKLISTPIPTRAEVKQVMLDLLEFNSLEITTPIVGWICASFFKERIFEQLHQFPLLFIFGAAGSGKTQTILNLKRMFCLETDNIKSIADITAFTVIKASNCNNTIPLMLDEYKPSMFTHSQLKMISKLIRASYNNEAGERGTASQEIRTYYYRSPIIIAGEQSISEPAARDRIVEVHMNKAASGPRLDQFNALQKAPLEKIGKLLLNLALSIDKDELTSILEQSYREVPDHFADRQRLNQSIVIVGIRLLAKALEPYDLAQEVFDYLRDFKKIKSPSLEEEIVENRKSSIDRALETIALMCDTDERYSLAEKYEYTIEKDSLFINLRLAHTKFMKFVSDYSSDVEAMNYATMIKLIKKEPYFVKDNIPKKMKAGIRLCVELRISELDKKGLFLQGLLAVAQPAEETAFKV